MAIANIWTCTLGMHHFRLVSDNNPENRKNMHKECTRCGKVRDTKEYGKSDGRYLGGLPSGQD